MLRGRQEVVNDPRRLAHDRRAAAREDAESAGAVGRELGMEAEIVDRGRDVILARSPRTRS